MTTQELAKKIIDELQFIRYGSITVLVEQHQATQLKVLLVKELRDWTDTAFSDDIDTPHSGTHYNGAHPKDSRLE